MVTLNDLLAGTSAPDGELAFEIPEEWRQGRTIYGGLTAALACRAARSVAPDLPPLASAQIAFVGPTGTSVQARSQLLRRGRNSAFVSTCLTSGDSVALQANFVFLTPRPASLRMPPQAAPDVPPPPDAAEPMSAAGRRPRFTSLLEYAEVPGGLSVKPPLLRGWVRVKPREGLDPISELLLVGDAAPPPVSFELRRNRTAHNISSAGWTINFLTPEPQTRDGWWLLETASDHAVGGMSSETTTIWNRDGQAVARAMQMVTIFEQDGGPA